MKYGAIWKPNFSLPILKVTEWPIAQARLVFASPLCSYAVALPHQEVKLLPWGPVGHIFHVNMEYTAPGTVGYEGRSPGHIGPHRAAP
jgi:hypothetical protein